MQLANEHKQENQVIPYLKGEFFTGLSAAALADLGSLIVPSIYASHKVLFAESQTAGGIVVVLEGEVRLSINSSEGRRLSFRIAKAGEVLGLSATLSGKPYEMTAETLYPAKIAHVSRQAFLQFLSSHPDAYQALAREMVRSFGLACDQLRTVGLSSSAPERLARLLLGWSEGTQRNGHGGRCRLSLTHEEIGEFIGASRETVTRTLSAFKHRRLVDVHGSTLTIPSRDALESYVCG